MDYAIFPHSKIVHERAQLSKPCSYNKDRVVIHLLKHICFSFLLSYTQFGPSMKTSSVEFVMQKVSK